jgi:endonuclease IV
LIHGPNNKIKFNNFIIGLEQLNVYKRLVKDVNFIIEMPTLCKSYFTELDETYKDYVIKYFEICVKNGFDICVDTAHMFANGLNVDDIIEVLEHFKGNYKFIHLNGNCRNQFTKDKHTIPINDDSINEPKNMIEDMEKLMNYISGLGVNCIMELKYSNYEYYKSLSDKFNFKIVDKEIHDLLA